MNTRTNMVCEFGELPPFHSIVSETFVQNLAESSPVGGICRRPKTQTGKSESAQQQVS